MLTVYTVPISLYCAKLRIVLRHKQLEWNEQMPPGGYGSDEYKTVVVSVKRRVAHPLYRRVVTRTTNFLAHDGKNSCGVGDTVSIVETRPISKLKRWRLLKVIRKAS